MPTTTQCQSVSPRETSLVVVVVVVIFLVGFVPRNATQHALHQALSEVTKTQSCKMLVS